MKKYKKVVKLIFCILMIFTIVAAPVVDSYAFAPAVYIGGSAILSGLLTAYGYSNMSAADVNGVYNSMPSSLQACFTNQMGLAKSFGMASLYIEASVINQFNEWFGENLDNGNLPTLQLNYYNNYMRLDQVMPPVLVDKYVSSTYTYKFMASGSSSTDHRFFYETNVMPTAMFTSSGQTVIKYSGVSGLLSETSYQNGAQGYGQYILYNGVSQGFTRLLDTSIYKVTAINFNLPVYNYTNTEIIGYLGQAEQTTPTYIINNYYNYAANPLPVDSQGRVNLNIPYTDNPDTNVAVPEGNSIDNPADLETVLQGYESIDGYFEQGGAITLADGTVIGDISEATRAAEFEGAVETGTGAVPAESTWVDGIPILGSILQAIRQVADNTSTAEAEWQINWTPITGLNFTTIFPFCIPFDLVHLIGTFAASPADYQMRIYLNNPYFIIDHTVDLAPFYIPIQFFRTIVVATFIYILIAKTRNMIKW